MSEAERQQVLSEEPPPADPYGSRAGWIDNMILEHLESRFICHAEPLINTFWPTVFLCGSGGVQGRRAGS